MSELDNFKEFCEGWIGGKGKSKPVQRNNLFTIERLKEQFAQIQKCHSCNLKRGAIQLGLYSDKNFNITQESKGDRQ